ncbi:acyltransferase [Bradyrhizobium sp.]|uniref:acyltransferase family protein n=1 Tax=Bradyrhizobium sp. TaxID=376 RepID=UPI002611D09F|nr:acyltransferase [Bradyrhizobium sp.]
MAERSNDIADRRDYFLIMRGIACLMVFLNHVVGLLSSGIDTKGAWYEPLIVPMGFPWVWLFLILSGFLLTKQFVDRKFRLCLPGILNFYERRSRRLLPMLWFLPLLLGLLYALNIRSPLLPAFSPFKELQVALALPWVPYVEGGNPVASVNSPVWSAVLEVHYFLLLPLILWCTAMSCRAMQVLVGIWLIGIAGLAIQVALHGSPTIFPMIYQQHLYNCGFMLAGCALALMKLPPCPCGWRWPILAVAMLIVGTQYLAAYDLNLALALLPIAALPVFSFLVMKGNSDYQSPMPNSIRALHLERGPLRWFELAGAMSYSIYLLHKPLSYIVIAQTGLGRWVTGLPSLVAVTILTAAAITPIILLSFVYVEVRFRRPLDRASQARQKRRAAG